MFDHTRRSLSLHAISLVVCSLVAGACSEDAAPTQPGPRAVASIVVTPAADTIVAFGASTQLSAEARDESGDAMSGQTFEWTSSDETIATVDQTGLVVALAEGMTSIEASAAGISGAAKITVEQRPAALVFVAQPSDAEAGKPISPEVRIEFQDTEGHVVSKAADSVSLALGAASNSPKLSGTTIVAAVGGIAIFKVLIIEKAGADYTLLASASQMTATSAPFSIAAGDPVSLVFLQQPANSQANRPMDPIRVAYVDDFGNTAPAGKDPIGLAFKVNPTGALLTGTNTIVPTDGVAEFDDLQIGQVGKGYSFKPLAGNLEGPESNSFDVELTFASISAGGAFTCAVTILADAYCWGSNREGRLGSPTPNISPLPLLVSGGLQFSSVSAGHRHACGVTTDGRGFCWGYNGSGRLGNGATAGSSTPVPVAGSLTFQSASAGGPHSCGLVAGGKAYCWGANQAGQLGDGTMSSTSKPVAVAQVASFRSVSAGTQHSCALTDKLEAYCWGNNHEGEVGDGSGATQSKPVPVAGGLLFTQLTPHADSHTCAVAKGDLAYCWGRNDDGQLGDGTTDDSPVPLPVAGGIRFEQLTAGDRHTCGLTPTGEAYCWGYNSNGELGDGSGMGQTKPVAVAIGIPFVSIDAGRHHTCAITAEGDVYCWGRNIDGEIGDGTTDTRFTPVQILQ